MKRMNFSQAIDDAISQAMDEDPNIIIFGEDIRLIRTSLFVRFGPNRILNAPISENAFLGAGVAAAMAGLRPLVEFYMVDFLAVAMDAILNHAAKLETFSNGKWKAPMVMRMPCGGGYGDGGQHEQTLWGWLAHIPGITVVVPSNPSDAGGLMLNSLRHDGPVVFMEHKLLSEYYSDFLGSGGRQTVQYDIPSSGRRGLVPSKWRPIPFGKALIRRDGSDLTIASIAVGVHRSLQAAEILNKDGISASVIDLQSIAPLDKKALCEQVSHTGRLLVVDEDYESFGLSGELAAVVSEAGIPFRFSRVCTQTTIPYARHLEDATLPNTDRILSAAYQLLM
jgi:pyruvate dehydrogenase E1 component beta subunit